MVSGVRACQALLMIALVATALPAVAGDNEPQTAAYDAPSSFVVTDVFGFGKLLCADPDTAPVAEHVRNGACFTYTAAVVGRSFTVVADDAAWDNASISVAVDVNGDGCVSTSCSGQPNPANDYLVGACGAIEGVLPEVEPGVAYTLQVFVRAFEVGLDGSVCGATTGSLTFTMA